MANMDSLLRAETNAELITLDEKTADFGYLPEDVIPLLKILTQPGDFCVSITDTDQPRISIFDEQGEIQHLVLEKNNKDQWRVQGMLFGSGSTIGELLYNLHLPIFDILSSLLGVSVVFRRLIRLQDIKNSMLLHPSSVKNMLLIHQDEHFKYFSAEVMLNERLVVCDLMQSRELGSFDWKQRMFNEIRIALVAEQKRLPIYTPTAMLVENIGYLVYRKMNFLQLDVFAKNHLSSMDVANRIKLMIGIVRVMAELHLAGVFHGALELQNFLVMSDNQDVLFNGGEGLVPISAEKHLTMANYSALAPEVAFTRRLTLLSDVYSLGKILKTLSDIPTETSAQDPNATILQSVTDLISHCLNRRPCTRPTMNETYRRLNELYSICNIIQE